MVHSCCKEETASLTGIALFTGIAATAALASRFRSKEVERLTEMKKARQIAFDKLQRTQRSAEKKDVVPLSENTPMGILLSDVKIDQIYLWEVEHLSKNFKSELPNGFVNVMQDIDYNSNPAPNAPPGFLPSFSFRDESSHHLDDDKKVGTSYNKLISTHECIIANIVRKPGQSGHTKAFIRAGPRENLHFNPQTVNAAIVTCGGLCPGLNNVIREITNSLILMYGIKGKVYGIRGGYKGFYDPAYQPIVLTPELVEDIHHKGGTMLSSSRGGFDLDKIVGFIEKLNIKQLYVIGGDGTHRGAFRIHEGCLAKVRRFVFNKWTTTIFD
jgi:6-phosphofructokinase 1